METKHIVIGLGIIVLILGGYIVYELYSDNLEKKAIENQQLGYNFLLNNIIIKTSNCEQYPIQFFNSEINQTQEINLVAVECLQQ